MNAIEEMSDALTKTLSFIEKTRKDGRLDLVEHYQASLYAFISFHQHDCTFENRACQKKMMTEYNTYIQKYKNGNTN